jgi:short-subunit dehydrogenase
MKIAGAHVLLTGGSKGIGSYFAKDLARRGARLTLIARPSTELKKITAEVGGEFIEADLSEAANHPGIIAKAEALNGPVDVLVNNAAVNVTKNFAALTQEELTSTLTLDLIAPMELSRQVLPGMLSRNRGTIANTGSLAGELASPTVSAYGPAKAGLTMHTMTLRRDLSRTNINAMVFLLGAVQGTDVYEKSLINPATAATTRRFEKIPPILTAEGVGAQMGKALAKGVESGKNMDVIIPWTMVPLIRLRLLPNSLLGRLLFAGVDPGAPTFDTATH